MTAARAGPARSSTTTSSRAAARPAGRGRAGAAAPATVSDAAVRHRGGPAPAGRRRQAVPPAAGAARRRGRRAAGDGEDDERLLTAACVVELTHLASLYHDDVMDEADLRRGRRVRQRALGQPRRDPDRRLPVREVLGAHRRARSRRASASRPETFTRLVEGQIRETLGPGADEDPLEHYLRVVADKTGSLIATSARYGARFAGAPLEVEEALTAYGEKVGIAFQLSDDILDVASESDESGKTPGTDLREGVPTLPVLIAQRSTDPTDARLLELLAGAAHRRRRPRRGARPAARPPGDGRGPCLRRSGSPARPRSCSRCCRTVRSARRWTRSRT